MANKEEIVDDNVGKSNIHQAIDDLTTDVINAIEIQNSVYGLYIVENEPDEDGEIKQTILPISINDVVDFKQNPPVINDSFQNQKIVICDRNGKINFYGTVQILQTQMGDILSNVLVPHVGALYKNSKLEYKGLFENGNKTQGVSYKEGFNNDLDIDAEANKLQSFCYDYKGDSLLLKHTDKDLLMVFTKENALEDAYKSYSNEYNENNLLIADCNTSEIMYEKQHDKEKIKNLTIKIDNSFKYDFKKKNNDFLDQNAQPQMYNKKDKQKMQVGVDSIISSIKNTIQQYPNLRNIEIQMLNNFGFQKDEFIEKIPSLRDSLMKNNISLFFKSVNDNALVANEKNEYCNSVEHNEKQSYDNVFYSFHNKSGQLMQISNEKYEKQLNDSGFYVNLEPIQQINDDDVRIHHILCDISVLQTKEKENKQKILEKYRDNSKKLKEEEKELNNKSFGELKYEKQQLSKLSLSDIAVIALSSLILPIVGGFISYYFLTKPSYTTKNKQDQKKYMVAYSNGSVKEVIGNNNDNYKKINYNINNDLNTMKHQKNNKQVGN